MCSIAVGELFQGHLGGGIIASRAPCGVIALPPPKSRTSLWESAAHRYLRDSWARGTGQIILSQRERRWGTAAVWVEWLIAWHAPECVWFPMRCMSVCPCVCVSALCVSTCMCVFSHLALISEHEKLPEWLWGNCPQLHIQTHVVSPKIRQGPGFTFQTSTSDRGQTMWKLSRNGPVAAYTCTRGLKVFLWF